MHTGIDLGLTCTSMVTLDDDGNIIAKDNIKSIAVGEHPAERYTAYVSKLVNYFISNNITGTIIMENPMGSFIGNSIKLAELKGAYLVALLPYTEAKKFIIPTAGEIKRYFTGYGAASKEEMIEEAKQRGYYVASNHEADALAMALMGLNMYSKGRNNEVFGKRNKRIS